MERRVLVRRLGIVFLFTLIAAPLSYVFRIILAKNLGVEQYGLFYAMIAFIGIIGFFNDFGMANALVHFIPKYLRERNNSKLWSGIATVFLVEFISSTVIAGLLIANRSYLSTFYFHEPVANVILPLFGIILVLESIFNLLVNIYKGMQMETLYSSMNVFRLFVLIIGTIMTVFLVPENILFAFIVVWGLSYAISLAAYIIPLGFIFGGKKPSYFEKKTVRELLKYGVLVMFGSAAAMLLSRLDVLMLTFFQSVESVGLYEIAMPLASIIMIPIRPIISFLFPRISYFYHAGRKEMIGKISAVLYNAVLFIFMPLSIVIALFPKEVITVFFGAGYVEASVALSILAFAVFFRGFVGVNFAILDGIGSVKYRNKVVYIGVVFNIVSNLFLIPLYGLTGAAITTAFSFFIMFLFSLRQVLRRIHFRPNYFNWLKICLASAIFVVSAGVMKTVINFSAVTETVIVVVISTGVYIILGFLLKILNYGRIRSVVVEQLDFLRK